MNLFTISGILGLATSALMAALMFARGKNKIHFIWGFFCVSVVLWDLGVCFLSSTADYEAAIFWWKIALLGIIFIPTVFNHFVYAFLEIKNRILIYSSYFISIALSIILFLKSGYLLSLKWSFGEFFYNYLPGPAYIFLTLFFFAMIGWGHYKLIAAYARSTGIKKLQLKYFFIGTLIGFSGGSFNFLPAYGIYLYPILNFTIVLYPLIIGYSIIKHRLMDIRIVIRSFFIYLNVLIFSYLLFYLFALADRNFFDGAFRIEFYPVDWLLVPLLVLAVYVLDVLSKKIANKYLFFGLYSYQSTINNLSKQLNNYIELNKIINSIVDTITKTMQIDRAGVLLITRGKEQINYQTARVVGFSKQDCVSLAQNAFLTRYLQITRAPLVREELTAIASDAARNKRRQDFNQLNALLEQIEVSLCLPLLSHSKLIGIIILGLKKSGDAYSQEDLALLSTLSFQAGIAISNAQYYKTVKDFNLVLQKKVDQQTLELRARAKALQEQNNKLNKLLEVKNEFLRVVNHQLNTPVSIIRNSIYMIRSGSFPLEKGLSFIEEGVKRMEEIFTDFWKAFSFEGEGIKLDLQETNLEEIIDRLVDNARNNSRLVKERGLEIKLEKNFPIPKVKSDPKQITQVASNLLENAVSYTNSGAVTISFAKIKDKFLKVFVADTGCGIDREDQKIIFEKFVRGKRAIRERPAGSGLGLYIAKKIIEANGGVLKLEKSEVGKGSTFSFTVPIWK